MLAPVQGYQCKAKKFRFIGQILDAWVGNSINDTNQVTVSSNGTAKRYFPVRSVTPITQELRPYHVLIVNVWGYITLASGASSGSATISVVINGTTAISVTITNTSNQQIVAFRTAENENGWSVGNIPSPANNNIEIQVTLGSGVASVTITQVQILDVIRIDGESSGTTVTLNYSGTFEYENEDPSIIIAPLSKVAIGYWQYINAISGTVTYTITGSSTVNSQYSGAGANSNTAPANVSGDTASGTITISVPSGKYVQILNWFAFVSYLARGGVTFPNGQRVFAGAIGFVKGVVYLLQGYFMYTQLPTISDYNTQLQTSHFANLTKLVNKSAPPAFYQGLPNYQHHFKPFLNLFGVPLNPHLIYCCGSTSSCCNILTLLRGGDNAGLIQYFTAVFIADNSSYQFCCQENQNLLIIEAEVIV